VGGQECGGWAGVRWVGRSAVTYQIAGYLGGTHEARRLELALGPSPQAQRRRSPCGVHLA